MKFLYSLWWSVMAFVFTLPYVNLWPICVLVALGACINVIYANHQTVQQVILALFFMISVALSFISFLVVGFFCQPFTTVSIMLTLGIMVISFLNYVVCILNYNSRWLFLLWFIGGIYLIANLITFVPYFILN